MLIENAKPNITHLKLAELEKSGKLSAIVTQNIDGLHQAAGSKTVYELHGSTLRNYCEKCHKFYDVNYIKTVRVYLSVTAAELLNLMWYYMKRDLMIRP